MSAPVFGDPIDIARARAQGPGRGRRKPGQPWADVRGAGPAGKTCKSCSLLGANGGCGKTYYKCTATKTTHGPGTDIRLKDPACILYKAAA